MTLPLSRIEAILKGTEGVTPGPWLYRPYEFDDWGWIRGGPPDADGRLWPVANARAGRLLSGDAYDTYRINNLDPFEANARHIANCDPQTIAELCALAIEGLKARQAALKGDRE